MEQQTISIFAVIIIVTVALFSWYGPKKEIQRLNDIIKEQEAELLKYKGKKFE